MCRSKSPSRTGIFLSSFRSINAFLRSQFPLPCIGYSERRFHENLSRINAVYERNDRSLCLISETPPLIAEAVTQSTSTPTAFWTAAVIKTASRTSPYIFPTSETNYWNALPQSAPNVRRSYAQTFTSTTCPSIGAFIRSALPCILRSPLRSALVSAERRRPTASPSSRKK